MTNLVSCASSFSKLPEHKIHIWSVSVASFEAQSNKFESFLSEKEKMRANKYQFAHLKKRYIVTRGVLRELLGKYLNIAPNKINFSENYFGKLYVDNSEIKFNLSHSRDLILYAFAKNREVGVDIEYIREDFDYAKISTRFFSKQEVCDLFSLPKLQQLHAFFACWVRKEAYIKALGVGLSHELKKFSVELSGRDSEVRLNLHSDEEDVSNWSLYSLKIDPAYAAAVVCRGQVLITDISCIQYG